MNNYRVVFKTSEPVGEGLVRCVKHDFVIAGVSGERACEQIQIGYNVVGDIVITDLGSIEPALKNWTVICYVVLPKHKRNHTMPVYRVKEDVMAENKTQAIERARGYYAAHDYTEFQLIAVYEGPYDENRNKPPVQW